MADCGDDGRRNDDSPDQGERCGRYPDGQDDFDHGNSPRTPGLISCASDWDGESDSAAFTLLEVMLTLAITVVVFAMIGGILISVISTTQNVEGMLKSEKAGYGVLDTMRRDLTGVYAYGLGPVAFKGKDAQELGRDADSLHFVTTADVMVNEDGTTPRLIEVGYRVAPDEEGKLLVLYRRTVPLQGDPVQSDEEYAELFGELHSLNFEYLTPEGEWVEEWKEENLLPRAVKINIELALSETERQQAQQGGELDLQNPAFGIVVGIATTAGPHEEEGPTPGN